MSALLACSSNDLDDAVGRLPTAGDLRQRREPGTGGLPWGIGGDRGTTKRPGELGRALGGITPFPSMESRRSPFRSPREAYCGPVSRSSHRSSGARPCSLARCTRTGVWTSDRKSRDLGGVEEGDPALDGRADPARAPAASAYGDRMHRSGCRRRAQLVVDDQWSPSDHGPVQSAFSDAMSMQKRYFTSDFSSRS